MKGLQINFAEQVAPLAGAWIEIPILAPFLMSEIASLPSRERGLKSSIGITRLLMLPVAPLAGAWIEIHSTRQASYSQASLPSRERGLKCFWGQAR